MEELKEKIARAMATESQYNFDHYADAALRAIDESGYEIKKKQECQHHRTNGSGSVSADGSSRTFYRCLDCGKSWETLTGPRVLEFGGPRLLSSDGFKHDGIRFIAGDQ